MPGHEVICLTPIESPYIYDKIELIELVALYKFSPEQIHLTISPNKVSNFYTSHSLLMAYITDGTCLLSTDPDQYYLILTAIKEHKSRNYDMDCWPILSNALLILSLPFPSVSG